MASVLDGSHRVGHIPTVHYVPDFISEEAEAALVSKIETSKGAWRVVNGRRLQSWGGLPHAKGMVQTPLPPWLADTVRDVQARTDAFPADAQANHVLVNEYEPGQGIMPHEDGPLYHPRVVILSLASTVVMELRGKPNGDEPERLAPMTLVLRPRSLLVFEDDAYTACLHGIGDVAEDTIDERCVNCDAAGVCAGETLARAATRFSLTIRNVPKVLKTRIRL